MAQRILEEEWDKDLFCNAIGINIVITKLMALTHEDPKSWASLSSIVESLTSLPFNFQLPDCCFRYEI
jgi:hypothetical protein